MSRVKLRSVNTVEQSSNMDFIVSPIIDSESGLATPKIITSAEVLKSYYKGYKFLPQYLKFLQNNVAVAPINICTKEAPYNRCSLRLNKVEENGNQIDHCHPKYLKQYDPVGLGNIYVTEITKDNKSVKTGLNYFPLVRLISPPNAVGREVDYINRITYSAENGTTIIGVPDLEDEYSGSKIIYEDVPESEITILHDINAVSDNDHTYIKIPYRTDSHDYSKCIPEVVITHKVGNSYELCIYENHTIIENGEQYLKIDLITTSDDNTYRVDIRWIKDTPQYLVKTAVTDFTDGAFSVINPFPKYRVLKGYLEYEDGTLSDILMCTTYASSTQLTISVVEVLPQDKNFRLIAAYNLITDLSDISALISNLENGTQNFGTIIDFNDLTDEELLINPHGRHQYISSKTTNGITEITANKYFFLNTEKGLVLIYFDPTNSDNIVFDGVFCDDYFNALAKPDFIDQGDYDDDMKVIMTYITSSDIITDLDIRKLVTILSPNPSSDSRISLLLTRLRNQIRLGDSDARNQWNKIKTSIIHQKQYLLFKYFYYNYQEYIQDEPYNIVDLIFQSINSYIKNQVLDLKQDYNSAVLNPIDVWNHIKSNYWIDDYWVADFKKGYSILESLIGVNEPTSGTVDGEFKWIYDEDALIDFEKAYNRLEEYLDESNKEVQQFHIEDFIKDSVRVIQDFGKLSNSIVKIDDTIDLVRILLAKYDLKCFSVFTVASSPINYSSINTTIGLNISSPLNYNHDVLSSITDKDKLVEFYSIAKGPTGSDIRISISKYPYENRCYYLNITNDIIDESYIVNLNNKPIVGTINLDEVNTKSKLVEVVVYNYLRSTDNKLIQERLVNWNVEDKFRYIENEEFELPIGTWKLDRVEDEGIPDQDDLKRCLLDYSHLDIYPDFLTLDELPSYLYNNAHHYKLNAPKIPKSSALRSLFKLLQGVSNGCNADIHWMYNHPDDYLENEIVSDDIIGVYSQTLINLKGEDLIAISDDSTNDPIYLSSYNRLLFTYGIGELDEEPIAPSYFYIMNFIDDDYLRFISDRLLYRPLELIKDNWMIQTNDEESGLVKVIDYDGAHIALSDGTRISNYGIDGTSLYEDIDVNPLSIKDSELISLSDYLKSHHINYLRYDNLRYYYDSIDENPSIQVGVNTYNQWTIFIIQYLTSKISREVLKVKSSLKGSLRYQFSDIISKTVSRIIDFSKLYKNITYDIEFNEPSAELTIEGTINSIINKFFKLNVTINIT